MVYKSTYNWGGAILYQSLFIRPCLEGMNIHLSASLVLTRLQWMGLFGTYPCGKRMDLQYLLTGVYPQKMW